MKEDPKAAEAAAAKREGATGFGAGESTSGTFVTRYPGAIFGGGSVCPASMLRSIQEEARGIFAKATILLESRQLESRQHLQLKLLARSAAELSLDASSIPTESLEGGRR